MATSVCDTCACVCVRVHVCTRVRVRVINGLKHFKRIYANPLSSYTLYMRLNIIIYYMWDNLSFFFVARVSRNDKRLIAWLNHVLLISLTCRGTWRHLIRRRLDLK